MARILIVDDDDLMRWTIRFALSADSHEFLESENGIRALEVLRKDKPDLVLTDLHMPEMGGLELIREMAGRSPGIPVVLITADAGAEREMSGSPGPVAILLKPFEDEDLRRAVKDALSSGPAVPRS